MIKLTKQGNQIVMEILKPYGLKKEKAKGNLNDL